VKVFGREPAFWVGVVQAVIAFVLTIAQVADALNLSDERTAWIMAVVNGISALFLAYVMRETMAAALVEVAKAVVGLMVAYGIALTTQQMSIVAGLVALIGAGYLRSQGAPLAIPKFNSSYNDQTLTAKLQVAA
jgi:hypothetical protein